MTTRGIAMSQPQLKLLDRLRQILRRKHYAANTEQAYVDWVRRFIVFHGLRHPTRLGQPEIEAFLTYLAVQLRVAAATQNQALNAIAFFYKHVLASPLDFDLQSVRARCRRSREGDQRKRLRQNHHRPGR
jgi:site-specific recombinase XerD